METKIIIIAMIIWTIVFIVLGYCIGYVKGFKKCKEIDDDIISKLSKKYGL